MIIDTAFLLTHAKGVYFLSDYTFLIRMIRIQCSTFITG